MRQVTKGEFDAWRKSIDTQNVTAGVLHGAPDLMMFKDKAGKWLARVADPLAEEPSEYWLDESQLSGGGPEPADSANTFTED